MPYWHLIDKPGHLNEATAFYVRTLERAGEAVGISLHRVPSIRALPWYPDVLTIDCKTASQVLVARPGARVWLWIQGIVPEEAEAHFGSKLRKAYWTLLERFAIPRARGTWMVSRAMQEHYRTKYGFRDVPVFVMPCVNQDLDPAAFELPDKYAAPTFVYAGSMHGWQCFDLTLDVFRRIQQARPAARLTVLTTDEEAARRAVRAAGLTDVRVGRVPIERLQETLRTFKYGFVLRREHPINAVATPTKTSSYMAAGVIPITTTAVRDFTDRLSAARHVVISPSVEAHRIAQTVLAFEERPVRVEEIRAEYRQLFDSYFDHGRYVPRIVEFLRATGLGADTRAAQHV